MRHFVGLMAIAALAAQPTVAVAAPSTTGASAARPAGALQARQETVRLALLQGQGQGQGQAGNQGNAEGPPPGRVNRTTVLSRVLLFAPAAAVAGLLIALSAGGRDRPRSPQ